MLMYILKQIILIFFVHLLLTTAAMIHVLNTQQVFNHTELPSVVEIYSNKTFTLLVRPEKCSYSNLTNCHVNQDMYFAYHLQCYSAVCSKKSYFCLNNPKSNTFHICGKDDKCYHKRRRSIAVTIPNDLYHVRVYSIACQPGYVQTHKYDCFSPCVKDESIIVKGETEDKRVLARCNEKDGYCNARNETYFEIGSNEDDCVVADDDLNIRCDEKEELMPDCRCVQECKYNEERDWDESLSCKPKMNYASMVTGSASLASRNGERIPMKKEASSQPTHSPFVTQSIIKSNEVSIVSNENEKSFKDKTDSTKDYHSSSNDFVGYVVPLVVILAFVILIVHQLYCRKEVIQTRKIVHNIYHNNEVKTRSETCTVNIDRSSKDNLLSSNYVDNNITHNPPFAENAPDEAVMKLLRSYQNQPTGITIHGTDETAAKEPY